MATKNQNNRNYSDDPNASDKLVKKSAANTNGDVTEDEPPLVGGVVVPPDSKYIL